jgi:hypothetical protein
VVFLGQDFGILIGERCLVVSVALLNQFYKRSYEEVVMKRNVWKLAMVEAYEEGLNDGYFDSREKSGESWADGYLNRKGLFSGALGDNGVIATEFPLCYYQGYEAGWKRARMDMKAPEVDREVKHGNEGVL